MGFGAAHVAALERRCRQRGAWRCRRYRCSLPASPPPTPLPTPTPRPPSYTARVELSSKVLDCFAKLERTLCHELCHVAAWLVDHTAKPPHGPVFRAWAAKAMALYSHLDITTCHAYEIFYPFRWAGRARQGTQVGGSSVTGEQSAARRACATPLCTPRRCVTPRPVLPPRLPHRWQCSNGECLQEYGRHSNSIDVKKKVCGACRSPLLFLGKFKPDGTVRRQRGGRLREEEGQSMPARQRLASRREEQYRLRSTLARAPFPGGVAMTLNPSCLPPPPPPPICAPQHPPHPPAPHQFAEFVKDNAAAIKAQLPAGTPHKEVMQRVAGMYAAAKQAQQAQQGGAGSGSQATAATAISLLDD